MNMTGNEFFQFTLVSTSLTLSSREKIQRESNCKHHSRSWKSDGEVVSLRRRNGAVSNEMCQNVKYICGLFSSSSSVQCTFIPHLRSQIFFRCYWGVSYFNTFHLDRSSSFLLDHFTFVPASVSRHSYPVGVDGRGLCILLFGPSVRSSLPLHIRNATTIETFALSVISPRPRIIWLA